MIKLLPPTILGFLCLCFSIGASVVFAQSYYDGYPAGYPGYPPTYYDAYPAGYPGYPPPTYYDAYPAGYPGYPPPESYDGYPAGYPGYPPTYDAYPAGYPAYPPPDSYPASYPGYNAYSNDPPPPCNDCSAQVPTVEQYVATNCGGCTAQEKADMAEAYMESLGSAATISPDPNNPGGYIVTCSNDGAIVIPPDVPLNAYPSYLPPDAYPSYLPPDAYPGYPGNPAADAYPSYPPPDAYPDYPPPDDYPGPGTLGVVLSGRVNPPDPWTTVRLNGTAPLNDVDLRGQVSGSATGSIWYQFDCTNDGIYDFTVISSLTTYVAFDICDYPVQGVYTATLHVVRDGTNGYATIQVAVVGLVDDLSIALKSAGSSFSPGENTTFIYTVTNLGPTAKTTDVGFWRNNPGLSQTCPGSPISPLPDSTSAPFTLAAGASIDIPFSFTVSSTPGVYTAYAAVSADCTPADTPGAWANNVSTGKTYQVVSSSWFEALAGDVGAGSDITTSGVPVSSRYTSQFLLAGNSPSSNTTTQRWRVSGYNQPQISTSPFDYVNDRFRSKATNNVCSTNGALSGLSTGSTLNYCTGDVLIDDVTAVPGGANYVWFVDGNLTVDRTITVPPTSTLVFVVKGNITINSPVSRTDGIYISGGLFQDSSSPNTGPQLRIDGSIYADDIQLSRSCDSSCSNINDPVEIITFQPKYIETLNSIFGSPAISWQEVAP